MNQLPVRQFGGQLANAENACSEGSSTYRSEDSVAYRMNLVRLLLCGVIDAQLAASDLSSVQWGVLKALFDGRAKTPTALCRIVLSDSGAMTRLLDSLENRGLIQRVRSASDRRSVDLALTDAGRAITFETLPLIVETSNRQLRGFAADEVSTIKQFMDRMIANLS